MDDRMKFKDCISENGWISPSKVNPSGKTKRKCPRTLTLNIVLIEKISEIVPENKRSALIDYILSSHFGIKYEDAYPESFAKSCGELRYWDSSGYYKSLDIKYPGRFSTKTKRRKQFSYKEFMLKIKE
jgi:hypothetical protein